MYVNTNKKNNSFLIIFILLIFLFFSCIISFCSIAPIVYCVIDEDNCVGFKSKIGDLMDFDFDLGFNPAEIYRPQTNTECRDTQNPEFQNLCQNIRNLDANVRHAICNISTNEMSRLVRQHCRATCNLCN